MHSALLEMPYVDHGLSLRRYRRTGLTLIVLFAGTFGAWAAMAPLSSAVVASGHFEVDGSIKKVQHKTGGTVAEILVHDGERVGAGDTLLRLDATAARSVLQIIDHELGDLQMSAARLRAERDGQESFDPPAFFLTYGDKVFSEALYQREGRMLKARLDARVGQKQELTERINQLGSQIDGLARQYDAKTHERLLLTDELDSLHGLLARKLVLVAQVNALEREASKADGELGQLQASIAEAKGKVSETKLQILNLDQVAVADASKELAEAEGKISELTGKRVQAEDELAHIDIKASKSGFVHEMSVHTVGGVIGAGEVLMMIVPEHAALNVELRVTPQEIESIHVGDKANVRISGLNRSTTPDLAAGVDMVGADLVQDPVSHISYYPVQLRLEPGEVDALKNVQLVPGMPVDAFVTTSTRTFLTYLWEPLSNRMSHAIREK
jgi:HlyD family secretion protein